MPNDRLTFDSSLRCLADRLIVEYAGAAGSDPGKPWAPIFGSILVGLVAAGFVGLISLFLRRFRRGEVAA